jgi:thiamine-monophosphate kinase
VGGSPQTVSDLGEEALVERIVARLGPQPPDEVWAGDDAALLRAPPGDLVLTTDVLVEGLDFSWSWCSGVDVGWKAVAVNASDLAAMGARPRHAVAALSLPASTPLERFDGLVEGMTEAAAAAGAAVVGGDLSGAREVSLSVALLGSCEPGRAVRRAGARPGEAICVTGSLGGAAGGLVALRAGLLEGGGDPALRRLAARQLRPRPRIEEGVLLAALGASSMIDVSDGLLADLARLMRAGGTGCAVEPELVPVDPDLSALAGRAGDPRALAATGGEDFELLFTIDPARAGAARSELARAGTAVTRIGVVAEGGLRFGEREFETMGELGWEHLRKR